jgi:Holliday junction resolvase
MVTKGSVYEYELKQLFEDAGWFVVRSAGSHGADLVALGLDDHMIVEVKSCKSDKYYTCKDRAQFDFLNALAKRGFNVYYFIRWKYNMGGGHFGSWSRFKLPQNPYPVFSRFDSTGWWC